MKNKRMTSLKNLYRRKENSKEMCFGDTVFTNPLNLFAVHPRNVGASEQCEVILLPSLVLLTMKHTAISHTGIEKKNIYKSYTYC